MKRIALFITAIFICGVSIAQTIRWHIGDTVYQTTTCNAGESITPPIAPDKFGYSFREWEVLYTRIEYLESTGTQWIDTGVIGNKNSGFYLDLNINYQTGNTNYSTVFGSVSDDRSIFGVNTYTQGCELYLIWGEGVNLNLPGGLRKQISYINGVLTDATGVETTLQKVDVNLTRTFSLFRYNTKDQAPFAKSMKLYNAKIYNGTTLIRDFIPVLDSNGTPCMYDRVENKFYYNQGTGNFIAGPIIGE